MPEYIEREALEQRLNCSPLFSNILDGGFFIKDGVLDVVQKQPTADVAEVRHGEWLQTQEPMGWSDVDCIECSSCHESWIMDDDLCLDDYKDGWIYCPNCGAKMDGKGDTE